MCPAKRLLAVCGSGRYQRLEFLPVPLFFSSLLSLDVPGNSFLESASCTEQQAY